MKILSLKGKINILTGLHIGGGDDTMKIGGIDNQVIKDPLTKLPYIPGSSLKGKMRSLLEWDNQLAGLNDGKPFSSAKLNLAPNEQNAKTLLKLFGDANDKKGEDFAITLPAFLASKKIYITDEVLYYYRDKDQKEVDLLYIEGDTIYPIEIKKGISPNNPDKNFSVLNKYSNDIATGIVICMTQKLQPINRNCWLSPVSLL